MPSSSQRPAVIVLLILFAGVAIWWLLGRWQRPVAVEFDNLKYIQLLSTAVSARNPDQVEKVSAAIDKRRDDQQMSEEEWGHFQSLIALARNGKWEEADRSCYDFAAAQLGRRRTKPATEGHDHSDHAH